MEELKNKPAEALQKQIEQQKFIDKFKKEKQETLNKAMHLLEKSESNRIKTRNFRVHEDDTKMIFVLSS